MRDLLQPSYPVSVTRRLYRLAWKLQMDADLILQMSMHTIL